MAHLVESEQYRPGLSASDLFGFLMDVAGLAVRAGFRGLSIFPDELQQYFDNGRANLRDTIQELRSLVWRFESAPQTPAGISLILVAPDTTEAQLSQLGNDFLDRLKREGLYLNLRAVYGLDFPARLWERYCDHFSIEDGGSGVVDAETLRAIGQIAVREDLGRGPRTVVNCIKLAIRHHIQTGRAYTPIDLAEDFHQNRVAFESTGARLRTAVAEAMASQVVNTEERRRAVLLLAAFPRGCDRLLWRRYGVETAVDELSQVAHAELVKMLAEGYTLRRLVEDVGDSNVLMRIIETHVRTAFDERDPLFVEQARDAFVRFVLKQVFEGRRGGGFVGWSDVDFALAPSGSLLAVMTGSFTDRFPKRVLAVQVTIDPTRLEPPRADADLNMEFILLWGNQTDNEDAGRVEMLGPNHARFSLNLRHRIGGRLPEDLRRLDDILSPNHFTPVLMLSLVATINEWLEAEGSAAPRTDQDEARVILDRLLHHSRGRLFPDELLASVTPRLHQIQERCIEEIFSRQCQMLFPEYRPLYVQAQYQVVWREYCDALDKLNPRQRRGQTEITATKKQISELFGLQNVTNFDVRRQNALKDVIAEYREQGRGDSSQVTMRLALHPLEQKILSCITESIQHVTHSGQDVPAIPAQEIFVVGLPLGYRREEIEIAAELLLHRHLISPDEESGMLLLCSRAIDPASLRASIDQYESILHRAPSELFDRAQKERLLRQLGALKDRLNSDADEATLDEVQFELVDFERHSWSPHLDNAHERLNSQLSTVIENAQRSQQLVGRLSGLDTPITSQLPLAHHLNDVRRQILGEQRALLSSTDGYPALATPVAPANSPSIPGLERLLGELRNRRGRLGDLDTRHQRLQARAGLLADWRRVLQRGDALFESLAALPDLRRRLVDDVCFRAQQLFTTGRGDDALNAWEEFQREVEELESNRNSHFRAGSEEFDAIKQRIHGFLRQIGAFSGPLHSRFEYGERDESYNSLYTETTQRLASRCNEIQRQLERLRADLLMAEKVQLLPEDRQPALQDTIARYQASLAAVGPLAAEVSPLLVQTLDGEFTDWMSRAATLQGDVLAVEAQISELLVRDSTRSAEEQRVLDGFENRRDADLTDLIVYHLNRPDGLRVEDVLNHLGTLYRKHQVKIVVTRIE